MKLKPNKTIVRISVGTLFSIILLLIWDSLTSDPYALLTINPFKTDWASISTNNININAFIQSMLSAVISLGLTIVFIEIILQEARDKEIEYKRKLQINNIAKVLSLPLFKYKLAAEVISKRTGTNHQDTNTDVDGYILADVFSPSLLTDEPLLQTKIELYSSKLFDLKSLITNILINTDLTDNTALSELFSEFLLYVNSNNPCARIIEIKDNTIKEFVIRTLPTTNLDEVQPDNILYPFRLLKDLLEYQKEFYIKLDKVFPQLTKID